ncbi:MAG: SagB/ThcOx family dehydrogenase [wastewater metagenome]|nr:SagB/ThcOx family dehydrogenase [Candidatus Loosdrechtia aerotolerans]
MKSIREYHEATKHSWEKLYRNRHSIDWSNEPNPFRTYPDCPRIDPGSNFEKMEGVLSHVWPFPNSRPGNTPVTLNTLSTLLYYSMAVSAWKSYPGGRPWSLRVNPSSGDLHPTETHLYVHTVNGLPSGAYHYYVKDHQVEQRATGDFVPYIWQSLGGTSDIPPVIIGLNSIFWREAWKYQSRALRYCYLDLGHAMACIMVAAHALGLYTLFIGEFYDDNIRRYLCLDKTDEYPLLFLAIDTQQPGVNGYQKKIQKGTIDASMHINKLSNEETDYPLIRHGHELTCKKCYKRTSQQNPGSGVNMSFPEDDKESMKIDSYISDIAENSLKWTIRKRRSALDFDGRTLLPFNVFSFLTQLLCFPYKADFFIPEDLPLVIPYLYIHRVEDLEKGVYYLHRTDKRLFPVAKGDMRYIAKELSLNQDIAGDSAFAVSFISNFDYALEKYGERGYRYIHYEAGLMGQALYLGATATGFDATGIGAFIDDDVHTFLKTPSEQQVVYHFTVGKRIDDPRLTTLPAYKHIHDDEEDRR